MIYWDLREALSSTVCVTGAGAGVDSAWEQKKLKARKMLENSYSPQRPVHALLGVFVVPDSPNEKRYHCQHAQVLHTYSSLTITKNELARTLILQKPFELQGLFFPRINNLLPFFVRQTFDIIASKRDYV